MYHRIIKCHDRSKSAETFTEEHRFFIYIHFNFKYSVKEILQSRQIIFSLKKYLFNTHNMVQMNRSERENKKYAPGDI